jgi:hypothetical protein
MKGMSFKPTKEQLKELAKYNKLLKKTRSGRSYKDQSTPAGAYITLISAGIARDMKLYREVNPSHWKSLTDRGDKVFKNRDSRNEICRIGRTIEEEGLSMCPIYTGYDGKANNIEVFVLHDGKWRKLFNTSIHNVDWQKYVSKYVEEMKEILSM